MATGVNAGNLLLICARILAVLAVEYTNGVDLSGTNQVQFGNFDHPPVGPRLSFVGIHLPEGTTQIEDVLSLLDTRTELIFECWQPVSNDNPTARLVGACLIRDAVLSALEADAKGPDPGVGSLFRLLHGVPDMSWELLGDDVHEGQTYARCRVTLDIHYRGI